jgi:exosortase A
MTSALRAFALPATRWRQALSALGLALVSLLVIYRDTAAAMVSIWSRSDTFAHAFLVLPIVLWLVWRQRHALRPLLPRPCPLMLVPMAMIAFMWLLGDLASVNSVTQLAMTALLVLAVPAVLGVAVARAILFPITFLFFAVPIGEFLLPQLMSWTADFTVLAMSLSGVPVYREGNQFTIPSGNWSVVEACSGVRYLIASFMVGTLFAYLNYRSTKRRWLFAGLSLVVPIVANWVRAYMIVMLGHLSSNRLAVGADHLIYGWLFFGLVMGIMYAIGTLWAEPEARANDTAEPTGATWPRALPRPHASAWGVATAAVLIALVPHLAILQLGGIDDAAPRLTRFTDPALGWTPVEHPGVGWKPAFASPTVEVNSSYAFQGHEVGVYLGYYRAQTYRHKLITSDNELVKTDDAAWKSIAPAASHVVTTPTEKVTVRTAMLRSAATPGKAEQRMVVWQLYWVGDKLTASDARAKAYGALDRVLRGRDDSAVIVLYALEERRGEATALLDSFSRSNLDAIVSHLRKSRDGARAAIAMNHP